jgi:hypothetical protein
MDGKMKSICGLLVAAIFLGACGGLSEPSDTATLGTTVAKTVIAELTHTAKTLPTATEEASAAVEDTDTVVVEVTATFIPEEVLPTEPAEILLDTPTIFPTLTPIATPRRAWGGPVCDSLAVIADITKPDGSFVSMNDHFLKEWLVKNTGVCPWSEEYWVIHVEGDKMGYKPHKLRKVSSPTVVWPGETAEIGIGLIAPKKAGYYSSVFQMMNDRHGNPFGALRVNIMVVKKKNK